MPARSLEVGHQGLNETFRDFGERTELDDFLSSCLERTQNLTWLKKQVVNMNVCEILTSCCGFLLLDEMNQPVYRRRLVVFYSFLCFQQILLKYWSLKKYFGYMILLVESLSVINQ